MHDEPTREVGASHPSIERRSTEPNVGGSNPSGCAGAPSTPLKTEDSPIGTPAEPSSEWELLPPPELDPTRSPEPEPEPESGSDRYLRYALEDARRMGERMCDAARAAVGEGDSGRALACLEAARDAVVFARQVLGRFAAESEVGHE